MRVPKGPFLSTNTTNSPTNDNIVSFMRPWLVNSASYPLTHWNYTIQQTMLMTYSPPGSSYLAAVDIKLKYEAGDYSGNTGLTVHWTGLHQTALTTYHQRIQLPPSLCTRETGDRKEGGNKTAEGQEAEQSNLIRISSPLF